MGRYQLQWRWTSSWLGMTWHFDADGRLVRIDDPFGGTTICTRGEAGRLEAMTPRGRPWAAPGVGRVADPPVGG